MANWGMKISRIGVDVNNGDDKDMIFTSKYSCLKGSLGTGIGGNKVVANDGNTETVTILHGLNYIPMVKGDFSFNNTNFQILPYFNLLGSLQIAFNIKADSTNVYLTFNLLELIGPPANYTIYYKCFIFLDKGKL